MNARLLLFMLVVVTGTVFGQTIQTQYGPVTGHANGSVAEFLGIPYAAPPTGTLRWKPTVAPAVWSVPALADQFPPSCPQKKYQQGDTTYTLEGDEDCLYLNVWSPDTTASLPVMVFIHGGGNQQGSTGEIQTGTELYHGKNLAERGNVIVVTIQYRLGPLGFLVHPGLDAESPDGISGNYAVLDQLFALQWVQNNIASFGGNPDNVTIFGESAGGLNVGNLLTTPLANGLFHRAIIQSAVPQVISYANGTTNGTTFVDDFIASGTDAQKIAYMRTLPADSITIRLESPISGGLLQLGWRPVIDGQTFFDTPENSFQSGSFNHVPLMIGTNSEEMSLSAPPVVTPGMVTALTLASVPLSLQSQAATLYPPGSNNSEARESYVGMLTDGQFTAPVRRTAQCISNNQNEPVWRYFFTQKHSIGALLPFGSYHGMELFYVFNNWENTTLGAGPLFHDTDDSTQQVLLDYWTNFAYSGNPNDGVLPSWPVYQASTDCYMELKATPDGTHCGLRTAESDLWDDAINYVPCTVSAENEDVQVESAVLLYPNPTTGTITVSGKESKNVSVYDLHGNRLYTGNNPEIDLTDFPAGIYFAEVETLHKTVTLKIVKQD